MPKPLSLTKTYTSYDRYTDSGVAWLGKVPEGWQYIKLKHAAKIMGGFAFSSDDYTDKGVLLIRIGEVKNEIDVSKAKYLPSEYITKCRQFIVRKKDILIAMTGYVGQTSMYPLEENGLLNQRVGLMREFDNCNHDFLYYLTQIDSFKTFLSLNSKSSAQENVSETDIGKFIFMLPPLPTQQRIATYLDEKTETIDTIIARKKRLVELLEEKRKSVISEAVEGVGEIREKLRRFVLTNPSKQEVKLGQGDLVSFLPMERVSAKGKIKLIEEREYQDVKDGFTYFRDNDVLIAKITPCFENGKGALVNELKNNVGFGSTEFIVLRSQDDILPKFVYYLSFSDRFRKTGEVEMRGSAGQKRVPENFVKDFDFAKPTLEKQKEIIDYLDKKSDEIDGTIKKVKQSIQLLTEYKSSLISHVVTGRVKV